jgi:hypothetical protein
MISRASVCDRAAPGAGAAAAASPQAALEALRSTGATYVIVHEVAYRGDVGPRTSAALREAGTRELVRHESDILFELERETHGAAAGFLASATGVECVSCAAGIRSRTWRTN